MSQVKPKVYLITHTPNPEEVIAMSARLCYSDADVEELAEKTFAKDQDKFIKKLMSFGNVSPIEHANFTDTRTLPEGILVAV